MRRSRDRFWDGDPAALDTLYTVLLGLCRVAAPLLPILTDHVYTSLSGDGSVHLTDWPSTDAYPADPALVSAMDRVRDVCSATLAVRKREGRRVRLPLGSLVVAAPGASALADFADVIADEVNVKSVELTDDVASHAAPVLQVVPAVAGPRLGPQVQQVIKAVKAGEWTSDGETVVAGGITLHPGEFTLRLVPADTTSAGALAGNDGVVVLDLAVTPELEAEGVARDLVRLVQQARRDAGLEVSDRISLTVRASEPWIDAARTHADFIAGETLALATELVTDAGGADPVIVVEKASSAG